MNSLLVLALVSICVANVYATTVTPIYGLSNSYVLTQGNQTVVIDIGADNATMTLLTNAISGKNITTIYITHGHPDHWGGFGGIYQYVINFPNIPLTVATEDIKENLFTNAQEKNITLPANLNITILQNSSFIPWVDSLSVVSNYLPAETDFSSSVYESSTNTFFSGDIIYNEVHLYLGADVDATKIGNWKMILNTLKSNFTSSGSPPVLCPGHGNMTSDIVGAINQDIAYLDFFLDLLCQPNTNVSSLSTALIAQYPTWGGTFVPPFADSNPAWAQYRAQNCTSLSSTPSPGPGSSSSSSSNGDGDNSGVNSVNSWLFS